jgi:flagellar hook-associated protein 3 FlgL
MPRLDMISSSILSQISRTAISTGQKQLAEAQTEVATGRHADIGLALGSQFGTTISLRLQLDEVTSAIDRITQASLRAEVIQTSLSTLSELATGFQSMLSGARGAESGKNLAAASGMSSLEGMQAALSTTYDGQYLFGGLMTDTTPLVTYSTSPRQTILAAFEASFGFSVSDPAATALTASEIESFLDGSFAALFSDDQWTPTWSGASDEGPVLRLSSGSAIDLQTNTNRPFARTLAQAFSMVEVLGKSNISQETFQAVADRALQRISEAQLQIGAEQARIGMNQGRLSVATGSLETKKKTFTAAIQALEGVDAYDAATRVNFVMTQLETSYALTGRISRMTLLSYI